MGIVHPPGFIRSVLPGLKWKINGNGKVIYLTFDDGPTPEITAWVLEKLRKYHAKATFFCVGRNIDRHPEIYENLKKAGHKIGNHTYSHLNGWKTDNFEYFNDIELAQNYVTSKLFRPPYGRMKPIQIKELKKKFKIIMWDVLSMDYDQDVTPEKCFENVTTYAKPGSVIVFHDSIKAKPNLYYTLPKVLEYYSNQGFKFRAIK